MQIEKIMGYVQDAGIRWIEKGITAQNALKKLENTAGRIECFIKKIIYVLSVEK